MQKAALPGPGTGFASRRSPLDKLAGGGSIDRSRVPYAQGVHLLCPSRPHGKAVNPAT